MPNHKNHQIHDDDLVIDDDNDDNILDEDFALAAKHQLQDWNRAAARGGGGGKKKKKNKNNSNNNNNSETNNEDDSDEKSDLKHHLIQLEMAATANLRQQQQQRVNTTQQRNRFGSLPANESTNSSTTANKKLSPAISPSHSNSTGFPVSAAASSPEQSENKNNNIDVAVIPTPTTTILPNAPKHRRVVPPQKFDIVLVMDFEATCDENTQNYPHEIIEFPCVAIDAHCRCTSYSTQMAPPPGTGGGGGGNKAIIGEFQSYVKPRRNPKLTPFCTELTGITQDQVDAAPSLPQVVASFEKWLYEELIPKYEKERLPLYPHLQAAAAAAAAKNVNNNNNNNKNGRRRNNNNDDDDNENNEGTTENSSSGNIRCVIACDGPWDIRKFLFELSVVRDGIYFPPIFYSFLNVRQEFATYFKCKPLGLGQTLGRLGFSFEGNPHSGIDDARNISRVVKVLLDRGHRFGNACRIGTTSKEGQLLHQSLRRVRDSSGGVVRPPRGSQDELLLFGFSRSVDDSESDDDGNDSEDQDGKKKTAKKKKKNQQNQQPSKAAIAQKQQQQQQQQQQQATLGLDQVLIELFKKGGWNMIKQAFDLKLSPS